MDEGACGTGVKTESEDNMKKHMKQWISLCLAGMMAVTAPIDVQASETTETTEQNIQAGEETKTQEDTSANTGAEAQEDTSTDGTKVQEDTTANEGTQAQENTSANEAGQTQEKTESATEENPDTSNKIDTGALEQEGEVTEPITKEDKPYLALGANLTADQQATVLELLGINPTELDDYDVIYVTNEEEHQYLGEYVSADKIGTRSLSSVLVVKREEGHGINITTKNISYCTIGMYKNALITAGITDADIIVAGPTPISGTAALVGALKAYSVMTGEEVSEESMDAALNELVLTGDIAQIVGDSQKAEELLAYLKQVIIENGLDSEEEIQDAIEDACDEFGITLTQDEIDQLITLLMKIKDLDLDLDTIMSQAQALYDKLDAMSAGGFIDKVIAFFQSIIDFFKNLF